MPTETCARRAAGTRETSNDRTKVGTETDLRMTNPPENIQQSRAIDFRNGSEATTPLSVVLISALGCASGFFHGNTRRYGLLRATKASVALNGSTGEYSEAKCRCDLRREVFSIADERIRARLWSLCGLGGGGGGVRLGSWIPRRRSRGHGTDVPRREGGCRFWRRCRRP